jgi:glycerol-3-phosphate O-acyltransferase
MNNIFFVSELFHRSGAFYIKRTGQKFPKIYRTLLNEYMKLILENEINIEFFIEASRSRTGQILYPKYGMLKYVFEAFFEKRIPNATLIPINVTYENLLEADSYITEHRGGQKVAEDTMRFIKSISMITQNYGRIILNSGDPISLKKYIADTLNDSTNTHNFRESSDFDQSIEQLGNKVSDGLQNLSVFMITNLVCCVLLMRHHYQLVKDLEKYVELLKV